MLIVCISVLVIVITCVILGLLLKIIVPPRDEMLKVVYTLGGLHTFHIRHLVLCCTGWQWVAVCGLCRPALVIEKKSIEGSPMVKKNPSNK